MGDRKQPKDPPAGAVKPDPPPAPPMRLVILGSPATEVSDDSLQREIDALRSDMRDEQPLQIARCATCRWWNKSHDAGLGACRKASLGADPFTGSMRVGSGEEWIREAPFLETDADFGCIQWEGIDED